MNRKGSIMTDIRIGDLRREDFKRAIDFAIEGMHFKELVGGGPLLRLYGTYFWYLELLYATQAIAAYADGRFVGALLASYAGEPRVFKSAPMSAFVAAFGFVEKAVDPSARDYYQANDRMLSELEAVVKPDGELRFLAAEPGGSVKGVGTALLEELARRERGKLTYLYTDSGCTYQFYEKRGFELVGQEEVAVGSGKDRKPLTCFLFAKVL